jgi:ribosomal protein S18 acetylase RimI-like enzyme
MTATVRRARPGDEAALHEVAAATFALACPPHMTQERVDHFVATVLSEANFAAYLADDARDLFLAEEDGTPIGYAMLVAGEPADGDVAAAITLRPTAELSKIYVLPGHHGSGASAALMTAAIDAATGRGAAGAWLGVNQLNERAQRFYGKSGFNKVGTKRFLVGDTYEDDFVFERPL